MGGTFFENDTKLDGCVSGTRGWIPWSFRSHQFTRCVVDFVAIHCPWWHLCMAIESLQAILCGQETCLGLLLIELGLNYFTWKSCSCCSQWSTKYIPPSFCFFFLIVHFPSLSLFPFFLITNNVESTNASTFQLFIHTINITLSIVFFCSTHHNTS